MSKETNCCDKCASKTARRMSANGNDVCKNPNCLCHSVSTPIEEARKEFRKYVKFITGFYWPQLETKFEEMLTTSHSDIESLTKKVTRFEVIDHRTSFENGGGRVLTARGEDLRVELSLQDDNRTLKVFLTLPQTPDSV